ncbi:hypothetical protein [Pelagibacterium luteolum]|uniref:Uncharacterized protein n=1 Tax=Pelagibacterium luteolum TaxID=440168 RepID=A0A1G8A886_9HYPH|nr:hypothetical protein [Pelagibacterium luteolum]SDH17205.1 hypothetical protein SAMN04487974_12717 [Pelagibacterium luteolum]
MATYGLPDDSRQEYASSHLWTDAPDLLSNQIRVCGNFRADHNAGYGYTEGDMSYEISGGGGATDIGEGAVRMLSGLEGAPKADYEILAECPTTLWSGVEEILQGPGLVIAVFDGAWIVSHYRTYQVQANATADQQIEALLGRQQVMSAPTSF